MQSLTISFFVSVLAGVIANYISKWLERKGANSNEPENE